MKSVELSPRKPYSLSFRGNILACVRGIAGLPVVLCEPPASQYIPTCLNPSLAVSLQCKILLVANLMTLSNVRIIAPELSPVFVVGSRQKLSKTA